MMKKFKKILYGYILFIYYHISSSYRNKRKLEAKRRIKICESCECFNKMFRSCIICNCLMDVKTKMDFKFDENNISIDGCLMKKW